MLGHPERLRAADVGGDRARRDAIHADFRCEFVGKLANESDDGVFGSRIERTAATNIEPCVGHGEDHVAARLQQFRHGSLGAKHVTLDVDAKKLVERLAQLVIRDFDEWERVVPNSGVADEAVEPAELACSARDGVAVVVGAGYVARSPLPPIPGFPFRPLLALLSTLRPPHPPPSPDYTRSEP